MAFIYQLINLVAAILIGIAKLCEGSQIAPAFYCPLILLTDAASNKHILTRRLMVFSHPTPALTHH